MKYRKFLKTFLTIAALSIMIFSAAHSLADDDDEGDEYDKKALERQWEQEKKEAE